MMYFITAEGKTPIKIPCAEPESTLKKKSLSFNSVAPLNVTGALSEALRAYYSLLTICDYFVDNFWPSALIVKIFPNNFKQVH